MFKARSKKVAAWAWGSAEGARPCASSGGVVLAPLPKLNHRGKEKRKKKEERKKKKKGKKREEGKEEYITPFAWF